MCVSGILQMRGIARAWNNTCKHGQHCDLFFFLMQLELE